MVNMDLGIYYEKILLEERLERKKIELKEMQDYFEIEVKNSMRRESNFEKNAINSLLEMKEVKDTIKVLEKELNSFLLMEIQNGK